MPIRTARPDGAGRAAFVESSEGRGGDAMPIIDDEFLSKLVREPVVVRVSEDQEKAFAKIARLSVARDRSKHELAERLEREGFSVEDAHAAIERAAACGLVDDIRYAEALVRSRLSQGKGRAGIENELAAAGIAVYDIPGWPDEYFPSDGPSEEDRAFELLCRKPPWSKNVYAAACRKLASRGFSSDAVFAAARRYIQRDDRVF